MGPNRLFMDAVHCNGGVTMMRIVLVLAAFGLIASSLPSPAFADYAYHHHHFKHRKKLHGHWHYYN
jgi:hypothetical protein